MNKVIAKSINNNIQISGYINGTVISINSNIQVEADHPVIINEFEINDLYARIKGQLNIESTGNADYEAVIAALQGGLEVDFSTQLDIAGIERDLKLEDEAKLNVTGDSEAHINKLVAEIRANVEGVDEIIVDREKSRSGRQSTYIRIYA
jgi:ribosomal protein L6P/L9E